MGKKEKKLTPKIRFKGFTDDWEHCKLGDVSEIITGGTPSTDVPEYWDGEINWYSPNEIGDKMYVFESARKITCEGYRRCSAQLLPADKTILFTSRAGIGNMAILKKEACTNQGFQSIVTKDLVDTHFIYFMGNLIKREAIRLASGSTFLEISNKEMHEIEICIPTKNEQIKISEIFRQLEKTITLHQKKIEKLEELKKAYLQQLFPKKGEKTPKLRLANFREFWKECKLEDLLEYFSSKYTLADINIGEGKYPIYDANSVAGYINTYDMEKKYISIIKDGAGVGRLDLKERYSSILATMGYLVPFEEDNIYFIYYFLKTINFEKYITGTTIPHIYFKDYKLEKCFLPGKDEIIYIGNLLALMDTLIESNKYKLIQFQNVKQLYLQNMFV